MSKLLIQNRLAGLARLRQERGSLHRHDGWYFDVTCPQ